MSSFAIPSADSGVSASEFAAAAGGELKAFAITASPDEVTRAAAAVDEAIALVAAGHLGTDGVQAFISVSEELGNGASISIEIHQR